MTKRKIAVVTGARATYGYSKRLMKLMEQSRDVKLQLVVTGMHLLKAYGYTLNEILKDGFRPTVKVAMPVRGDTPAEWAKSIGVEIEGMARVFDQLKPDLVVVSGDRAEMLGATVAAAYMNLPVAHIQAGDVSGHIDGSARHAISKLAHIHFASCEDSAERLRKMGEEPWRIFNVGAPQLDEVVQGEKLAPLRLAKMFHLDLSEPILMVIQHPVLTETNLAGKQMRETLEAVKKTGYQTLVIYPNVDAAGQEIISVIREYEKVPKIQVHRNIDRQVFLSLLRVVSVLVGNSSCGILEAPSFRLPAVDIGTRQTGRMRACNVISVQNFDCQKILSAIRKSLHDKDFRSSLTCCLNPYGDGRSSERILKILRNVDPKRFLVKRIVY